jgi:hypothetical protein
MMNYLLMAVVIIGMLIVVMVSAKSYSPTEWVILGFFLVVIGIVGANYLFGVNIEATLRKITTAKPELDFNMVRQEAPEVKKPEKPKKAPKLLNNNQVFHVPGQYDYTEAKALCRAYGGSLANIQQMMDAYEHGAEWCDYGWSEDQMALYPTQTKTWQTFKESELHEKDCGRPGVNGGYTMDLKQKLGANCFGKKPKQNGNDIQPPPFPKDPLDSETEKFKANLPNVSPFNYEKWNE